MTEQVTATIKEVSEDLFSVSVRVGIRLISAGYFTNVKIEREEEFVSVFVYSDSTNHCNMFAVDKVIKESKEKIILPKKPFESIPAAPCNSWVYPNSESIHKYFYSKLSKTLTIIFNSNQEVSYTYGIVDYGFFFNFHYAESKGRFFIDHIKKNKSLECRKEFL